MTPEERAHIRELHAKMSAPSGGFLVVRLLDELERVEAEKAAQLERFYEKREETRLMYWSAVGERDRLRAALDSLAAHCDRCLVRAEKALASVGLPEGKPQP